MDDEEILCQTEVDIDAWLSSSLRAIVERINTDGVNIDVGTTEVVPSDNLMGSWKSDTPTC